MSIYGDLACLAQAEATTTPYLSLKSTDFSAFTLAVKDSQKHWDGSLYYSTDKSSWTEWNGTTAVQSVGGALYLRGTGNTIISGSGTQGFSIAVQTGAVIKCSGNIETILDWETVAARQHPVMGNGAYAGLFAGCPIKSAPSIPATTLTADCYSEMFSNCMSLTTAPVLPAMTMAGNCYYHMFQGCISLVAAPALPATTLASGCYQGMFYDCPSLTTAPELPATTLATHCYAAMFNGCTSLTTAPELPATALATYCYRDMFTRCAGLTTAPVLPATTLESNCYDGMFKGCTSLTTAPELPATALATYCYHEMFTSCTSLTTVPALPATTLANFCYYGMFYGCTSLTTVQALPATTLAIQCYRDMFRECQQIGIYSSQSPQAQYAYRIPTSGTGTTASSALSGMFYNTDSAGVWSPEINITYYVATPPVTA